MILNPGFKVNVGGTFKIDMKGCETGFTAQFKGEASIELYAVNGILIEKKQVSQFYSRNLNKGVYILCVNGSVIKLIR